MTGLPTSTVSLRFDKGIDTKTDAKLVEPPFLTRLENGIFTRGGSIKKRAGTVQLDNATSAGSAITAGSALATFGDELLLFDDTNVHAYSGTNQQWVTKGTAVSVKATKRRIISNDAEQTDADMCLFGNIALFAWKDSRGGVRASVLDLDTGTYFMSDASMSATGTNPKCFAIGPRLFVSYVDSGSLKVRRTFASLPTSFEAENTLVTNVNASKLYDVIAYSTSAAAFTYSTTGNEVRLGYITVNGFLGVTGNGFAMPVTVSENPANCLTLIAAATPDKLYVAYHNGTNGLRVFGRNADLTAIFAPVTVDSTLTTMRNVTGVLTTATSMQWFYEQSAGATYNALVRSNTLTTSGTAGTAAVFKRSVGLASKAWLYNSLAYVTCGHSSTLQATYFTFVGDGTLISKQLGAVAGGLTSSAQLPRVETLSAGVFAWAALEKGKLRSDTTATVFTLRGVTMSQIDFTYNSRFVTAQLGNNLHVVGGILQAYDGYQLVEHGFHLFPENITATSSTSGGSMAAGTYGYKFVYEWTDAQGQLHRSAPSVTVSGNGVAVPAIDTTIDSGSTGSVSLTIPTLRITGKTRVIVTVYRATLADSSTFYRLGTIAAPLLNDTTADTVAFTDTFADASITSSQILYTVGGVLDNDAPPPCSAIVAGKRRLFLVSDEDRSIWYSKQTVVGEGAAFSLAQQIVPQNVTPTAVAVLDDKVIVFESHRIFGFAGDGPNALGQQDSFSPLELINSDVGCANPVSIVRTSQGLMFQSAKGIYLLDRSLQCLYVGAPVELYNAETVTSATLLEGTNQVRFTTAASKCLVFDYFFGQWSTFTGHEAADGLTWNGSYLHLKSNGRVLRETSGVFTDNARTYSLLLETAWIKFAGLMGFQRVRRMALVGDVYSAHTLVTQIAYDYQDYYTDTLNFVTATAIPPTYYGDDATYGSGALYGSAADIVYSWRSHLPRQKCQAIRFLFQDDAETGESYAISGLDFEVAVKAGLARLRAAKTI